MPAVLEPPYTEGVSNFSPDDFFTRWASGEIAAPQDHDLKSSIRKAFNLPTGDKYIYHALVSVTLAQVQRAISFGSQHGLHAWYRDEEGKEVISLAWKTISRDTLHGYPKDEADKKKQNSY